jgi:hypothetical protein
MTQGSVTEGEWNLEVLEEDEVVKSPNAEPGITSDSAQAGGSPAALASGEDQ